MIDYMYMLGVHLTGHYKNTSLRYYTKLSTCKT